MSDPFLIVQNETTATAPSILAETYYGATKEIPLASLRHRVSVYAIIIEQERILMIKTHNHRYYFPGGGLDVGETLHDAIQREAREELNAEVEVGALVHADDMVYYHDPVGRAAHLVRLYYECRLRTRELTYDNAEERNEMLSIDWVPLYTLNEQEFLPSTWRALNAILARRTR